MSRVLPLSLLLSAVLAAPAAHAAPTPITIEQAMADPDWIGPPVERAWWTWDGKQVQYELKRDGSSVRDTFQQALDGAAAHRIADDQRAHVLRGQAGVVGDMRHQTGLGQRFLDRLRRGRLGGGLRCSFLGGLLRRGLLGALCHVSCLYGRVVG